MISALVLLGSALGGLARFWLGLWALAWWGGAFPWGTLLINVLGSAVIGVAAAALPASANEARAFLMVGVCGGFTTFSSFSLQALDLLQAGRAAASFAYVAASVLLCIGATAAGWALGRLG